MAFEDRAMSRKFCRKCETEAADNSIQKGAYLDVSFAKGGGWAWKRTVEHAVDLARVILGHEPH